MKFETYADTMKSMWIFDPYYGVIVIPRDTTYFKNDRFTKADFDYYKSKGNCFLKIINELTSEANKMSLSQINNVLDKMNVRVTRQEVISQFYSKNNWGGQVKDKEKKDELKVCSNQLVKNIEKNHNIIDFTVTTYDNLLKRVKQERCQFFTLNGEVYFVNALKARKSELCSIIKEKRGKEKRLQRIKENKYKK